MYCTIVILYSSETSKTVVNKDKRLIIMAIEVFNICSMLLSIGAYLKLYIENK